MNSLAACNQRNSPPSLGVYISIVPNKRSLIALVAGTLLLTAGLSWQWFFFHQWKFLLEATTDWVTLPEPPLGAQILLFVG